MPLKLTKTHKRGSPCTLNNICAIKTVSIIYRTIFGPSISTRGAQRGFSGNVSWCMDHVLVGAGINKMSGELNGMDSVSDRDYACEAEKAVKLKFG